MLVTCICSGPVTWRCGYDVTRMAWGFPHDLHGSWPNVLVHLYTLEVVTCYRIQHIVRSAVLLFCQLKLASKAVLVWSGMIGSKLLKEKSL